MNRSKITSLIRAFLVVLFFISIYVLFNIKTVTYLLFPSPDQFLSENFQRYVFLCSVLIIIVEITIIAFYYLQYGFPVKNDGIIKKNSPLGRMLRDLTPRVTKVSTSRAIQSETKIENSSIDFRSLIIRVNLELARLSRSANFNLAIGGGLTLIAIIFLAYESLIITTPFKDTNALLSYFIPRVTTVIFAEVFAFFFLKIYKDSLADIKYYNNELTNIEVKAIALNAAKELGKEDVIKSVIDKLSLTERNFILKKGESTTHLEKSKLDNSADAQLQSLFTDFLKFKTNKQ